MPQIVGVVSRCGWRRIAETRSVREVGRVEVAASARALAWVGGGLYDISADWRRFPLDGSAPAPRHSGYGPGFDAATVSPMDTPSRADRRKELLDLQLRLRPAPKPPKPEKGCHSRGGPRARVGADDAGKPRSRQLGGVAAE